MKVIGVIPARYAAVRFPGKPLELLSGKPLIQWVYESASACTLLDELYVATDDDRIFKAVENFGGKVRMTAVHHRSGTERLAEIAESCEGDVFVNIQGDEPLIEEAVIRRSVELIQNGFEMATAMAPLESLADLESPNVVKVIVDKNHRALYFSRFAIPYSRQKPEVGAFIPQRHIGLYAYRRETLLRLASLPASSIEMAESLEQLRALENGISIGVAAVQSRSFGIDTPEDLKRMEIFLTNR